MSRNLKCIYISFNQADVNIREKAALTTETLSAFVKYLKDADFAEEFFVLSTCNRTEIYYVDPDDLRYEFINRIQFFKSEPELFLHADKFVSVINSREVIRRLLALCNGMLSQVLGDVQIIRQIKTAYKAATAANTTGPYLNRLIQLAFACHKEVASRTAIHDGCASVSSAAAILTDEFLKNDYTRSILIVGAGEFSHEVVSQLRKKNYHIITIANRNLTKARELSEKFNLRVIPFESISDLGEFDVVISCVSSPAILISADNFKCSSVSNEKLLIDLSVPRVMDSALEEMPGIRLVNMDRIAERNEKALQRRRESFAAANRIIDVYYASYETWEGSGVASPELHHFKNVMEEIRRREVKRHLKKDQSGINADLLETITKNMINKIVRMPAVLLSPAGGRTKGERVQLNDALIKLFSLRDEDTGSRV